MTHTVEVGHLVRTRSRVGGDQACLCDGLEGVAGQFAARSNPRGSAFSALPLSAASTPIICSNTPRMPLSTAPTVLSTGPVMRLSASLIRSAASSPCHADRYQEGGHEEIAETDSSADVEHGWPFESYPGERFGIAEMNFRFWTAGRRIRRRRPKTGPNRVRRMFTGIIEAVGEVAELQSRGGDVRRASVPESSISEMSHWATASQSMGVPHCRRAAGRRFVADVSRETLSLTSPANPPGGRVNLEKAPTLSAGLADTWSAGTSTALFGGRASR